MLQYSQNYPKVIESDPDPQSAELRKVIDILVIVCHMTQLQGRVALHLLSIDLKLKRTGSNLQRKAIKLQYLAAKIMKNCVCSCTYYEKTANISKTWSLLCTLSVLSGVTGDLIRAADEGLLPRGKGQQVQNLRN